MIAGPNGAGKTTMARALMKDSSGLYEFINADEIAKGLSPQHPEQMALTASKLMIKRLKELLDNGKGFAFETTGAGTNYVRHLKLARSKGYETSLTFLWLSSPKEAVKRVAQRVKQGGHHVPEESIVRRYFLGIKNLITHYLPLIDEAFVMDNSSEQASNRIIASKKDGLLTILSPVIWEKMQESGSE